jgi:hypothetical protein
VVRRDQHIWILRGFLLLDWSIFVPSVPLGVSSFQAGLITWTAVVVASYLLGHAAQAIGNVFLRGAEDGALGTKHGSTPLWMRERARQTASEILKVDPGQLTSVWIFRTMEEYATQIGKEGDRDIFIYLEGFYRGTAVSLIFLAVTLAVRMFFPGCSIQFTRGLFYVSRWELFTTLLIATGVAFLFIRRYRRFAEYRVTRAVLAALTNRQEGSDHKS